VLNFEEYLPMPHFADFHNISAKFDTLIQDNLHSEMRVPVSEKHHISMSITRIGLFKTGGINVELVSISKFGALFNTSHHALLNSQNQDMTIELSLNGKHFKYDAHVVQQDSINNFYGIKFEHSIEAIDDYLTEHCIRPRRAEEFSNISSVWLDLVKA
jgi:hypothetical protein